MKKSSLKFILIVLGISLLVFLLTLGINPDYLENFINIIHLFSLIFWIIIGILIHEAGHLVFGLLTGYKFMSFQVFNFLIKKTKEGKIKVKRIVPNGLAGQCIMTPPQTEKRSFVLYNSGGFIINFLAFAILALVTQFVSMNRLFWQFLFLGSIFNLFLGLMNAIPFPGMIVNDGLNMRNYKKNPALLDKIYQNIDIVRQLNDDVLYKDLVLPPQAEKIQYSNTFDVFIELIRIQQYLDSDKLQEAGKLFKKIYQKRHSIFVNYRYILELIYFVYLVLNHEFDLAKDIYQKFDKKLVKALPKVKSDVGAFVHVLSLILYKYDKTKAKDRLKLATKYIKRSTYLADAELSQKILSKIENFMKEVSSMNIILASKSPRRKEILNLVKIPFRIIEMDQPEIFDASLPPFEAVQQVALAKAKAVSIKEPDAYVIGADTIVVVDELVLGKPKDEADAIRMLELIQNRTHQVITGVAIVKGEQVEMFAEVTSVTFSPMTKEEILDYVRTENVYDKAGAYAIQGQAARFIQKIEGDYYNVVGLPIAKLYRTLKKYSE